MAEQKRGLNYLTSEEREKSIDDIISYFSDERGEDIGVVAAGDMVDFFVQHIGARIYNAAVDDVKSVLHEQLEELDGELDVLRREM